MRRLLPGLLIVSASTLHAQGLASPVARIPLRVASHVSLEVSVNGAPATLILDTGASNISLDSSFAARAAVRVTRPLRSDRDGEGVADSVRIGDVVLRDMPVTVKSFAALRDPGTPPLLGVVGTRFLERYVARIDFDSATLTLFDRSTFVYSGTGVAVPVEFVEGKPRTRVTLERADGTRADAQLFIDLGSANIVVGLTPAFAAKSGIDRGATGVLEVLGGRSLYGQGMDRVMRLPSGVMGDLPLTAPLVTVSTALGAALTPKQLGDGTIGLRLLSRTVMFLDYARKRIIFEPTAQFSTPVPFANVSGLQLGRRNGALVVRYVIAGSPAASAGVRADDELIAVDGVPVPAEAGLPLRELQQAGTTRALTLRRAGETITLSIALRPLI